MNPSSWKMKAIAAAVTIAVIAGVGAGIAWWATSTSYKADIATLEKNHSDDRAAWDREKTAITTKAQQDTAYAMERTHQAQDEAAAADKNAQEKLAHAERENAALRDDITAGRKRVRILEANIATANLAASQHATGGSASASGVGDAVQVELSAVGQQTVLDLQQSTERDAAVIEYFQDYTEKVVKQCKR